MSKIIDALRARTPEPTKNENGSAREVRVEKSNYELTQEQLADIYFSATGKQRPAELPPPIIVRVVEKAGFAAYMPWIITSIAFLITALSLFSTKRILVDIKVIDDKQSYAVSEPALPPMRAASEEAPVSSVNKISLQECVFEGAAYLKSTRDKDGLTLVNSSVSPFARATMHFDPPINLEGATIVFYAKGAQGGENIAIAMKDKENVQGFDKGRLFPFPHRLTTEWQRVEVPLSETSREFDARNLTSLRLEFGSKDIGNKPGDTVYIKDLQWVF